jgi:hypothetical protein
VRAVAVAGLAAEADSAEVLAAVVADHLVVLVAALPCLIFILSP